MVGWSKNEFRFCGFYDKRMTKSVMNMADAVSKDTVTSFSAAVGPAIRQAATRTFHNERVTVDVMLSGHQKATLERLEGHDYVYGITDTTVFNLTGHKALKGIGSLNNKESSRGLLAHNSLVCSESGTPLGVVDVDFWARDPEKEEEPEQKGSKVPIEKKESYKWIKSMNAVENQLSSYLDGGGRLIIINDRESDYYDFFVANRHVNTDLLIRVAQNRKVQIDSEHEISLYESVASVSPCDNYEISLIEEKTHKKRIAKMELRYQEVLLLPPVDKRKEFSPITVWVVTATEIDAPEGVSALSWRLLSTIKVKNKEEARLAVDRYRHRWLIEILHHVMKSGLNAEKLQFSDLNSLENALALYYVIAWQVLWLLHSSRENPDLPAYTFLDPDEIEALSGITKKPIKTMLEVVKAIASLGGYHAYAKAPLPGVKMVWLGLRRFADIMVGVDLFKSWDSLVPV